MQQMVQTGGGSKSLKNQQQEDSRAAAERMPRYTLAEAD